MQYSLILDFVRAMKTRILRAMTIFLLSFASTAKSDRPVASA